MPTSFSSINDRFLRKITDYRLAQLIVYNITAAEDRMYGWMESAIPNFTRCNVDLSDRDLSTKKFNKDLSDSEQEIIAYLMVVEWLEPEVKKILEMGNTLFNNDMKTYSNANLLHEKQALLEAATDKADRLIVAYTFENIDFSRLG